jgi:hypothetical protein
MRPPAIVDLTVRLTPAARDIMISLTAETAHVWAAHINACRSEGICPVCGGPLTMLPGPLNWPGCEPCELAWYASRIDPGTDPQQLKGWVENWQLETLRPEERPT